MFQVFDKISLALGHVIGFLALSLFFIVTAFVSVSSFGLLISAPFEYGYGQDDLALADLIALSLLALASWRYFRRGIQSGTKLWPLLKRFAFTLTFVALLLLSALGIFASIASIEPELANEQLAGGADDLLLYGIFGIFVVAIYGATPLPALFFQSERGQDAASAQRNDGHEAESPEAKPPILNPSTESRL